jgi:allophanate hydrolase
LPLYGIPFAVKDNIDVEGFVTTAGCPAFAYTATRSAKAVQTLLDAGAIFIGKTNLDQFATGLAGVRSPYGVPRNPFDSRYIPGGSSSGSAVAVASGLVSFALGTDTAGSGRVPAALNNIAGWKPTPGAVSSEGVVPACRSLDCLSVFALTCGDAALVARTLTQAAPAVPARTFRFGVPAPDTLEFFGDPETPGLFQAAIENLTALGGTPVTVDIAPLREVALLLYEGPWLAERTAALKDFLARHPGDMLPVTRSIIEGGAKYSAVEAFEGLYRLAELKQVITPMWEQIDTLLLPTVATTYTVAEVEADPIVKNSNLGYYTNFVNLLGYAGVSVPSGFTTQGLPFGVTLIGSGGSDDALLRLGDRLHRLSGLRLGATQEVIPSRSILADGQTIVAVAGAHLRGLPLNQQLLDHDALFVRASKTAPVYRLYELPGSLPPKPGLVRVAENGVSIAVELWQMPLQRFGEFVDLIPPPLGIGSLTLDGGEVVKGFLCEPAAVASARDISGFGGWKAFLASHAGGISTGSARTATSTVCSP